jgi:hypothetical protein
VSPRPPLNDQGGRGLAQVAGATQGAETTLPGGKQRCTKVCQQVDKSRRSGNLHRMENGEEVTMVPSRPSSGWKDLNLLNSIEPSMGIHSDSMVFSNARCSFALYQERKTVKIGPNFQEIKSGGAFGYLTETKGEALGLFVP